MSITFGFYTVMQLVDWEEPKRTPGLFESAAAGSEYVGEICLDI